MQEAQPLVELLKSFGYEVTFGMSGQNQLKELRKEPPDLFVIDLSHLPSHGREIGAGLRSFKSTQSVPLVFVDGVADKVQRVRDLLPDAVFTNWENIETSIKSALENPQLNPVKTDSIMAGYIGTPLPKKLGIKDDMNVGLLLPPDGFPEFISEQLPSSNFKSFTSCLEYVDFKGSIDLQIWFVRSMAELNVYIEPVSLITPKAGMWIAWQKKSSGIKSDVTQQQVRDAGLSHGLVDYKICSINDIWSGLKFAVRKL